MLMFGEFFGGTPVPFTPVTDTYASAASGSETIPAGASQVVIEDWGAGAGGTAGQFTGCAAIAGESGSSGAYSKTILSLTSADWGKTLAYVVGAGGSAGGSSSGAGSASTVSSGTKTITTMTANGGAANPSKTSNGGGNTATGGNTTNTSGNAGSNTLAGAAAPGSPPGTSGKGGNSGFGIANAGAAGNDGCVRFAFT
jgi:hypothetical protein